MKLARIIAVTAALGLCACGGLGSLIPEPQNLQIYMLRPAQAAMAGQTAQMVNWQLSVAVPDAARSLDTERIALNPTPATVDYYANARWPDRAPLVVQSALVEAFQTTGKITAVSRDTSGLAVDYALRTELREFQAKYDAPNTAPTIAVRIGATLVQMPEGRIIKTWETSGTSLARGNTVPDVVAAFDAAMGTALSGIVTTTLNSPPPVH